MKTLAYRKFRRWAVQQLGAEQVRSSADGKFNRWGVQEIGTLAHGKFRCLRVEKIGS